VISHARWHITGRNCNARPPRVKEHFPELKLKCFFVDFSGIHMAGAGEIEQVA